MNSYSDTHCGTCSFLFQWAATRADLFPPDMCAILTSLQSDAPCHDFRHTRATVEAAFGQPLEVRLMIAWLDGTRQLTL